jgi:hypothetical protein
MVFFELSLVAAALASPAGGTAVAAPAGQAASPTQEKQRIRRKKLISFRGVRR